MAVKGQRTSSTAVVKWDEELARRAEIAAKMEEGASGGQFFGTRGGTLTWQDAPLKDNQMGVIILDSILENVYYEGRFDPETPQSPMCFAFGRDEKEMAPHKIVVEARNHQHPQCQGCELNEFGTADQGKGKACRNTRRVGMISAGSFTAAGKFEPIDDQEHFATAAVGYMKLPVTSVKGYAGFVKQVASALKRPPFGIFTKVKLVPDQKNQFKVLFEPISTVPDHLMETILARHEEVKAAIDFPYVKSDDTAGPKANSSRAKTKGKGRKY